MKKAFIETGEFNECVNSYRMLVRILKDQFRRTSEA
jgi:hypothetical protein